MHDPSQEGEASDTETINVVPLADLTLVLLVILMVLSPMITQSMIHVATPAVKSDKDITPKEEDPDAPPPEPLMISITADKWFLNSAPAADLEQLVNGVAARLAEKPERPVLVSADKEVSVGRVVEVLDTVKSKEPEIAEAVGDPGFTVRMSLLKQADGGRK